MIEAIPTQISTIPKNTPVITRKTNPVTIRGRFIDSTDPVFHSATFLDYMAHTGSMIHSITPGGVRAPIGQGRAYPSILAWAGEALTGAILPGVTLLIMVIMAFMEADTEDTGPVTTMASTTGITIRMA